MKRHARKRPKHSLGRSIKEARERAGMTQLALSHLIGYRGENAGAYISRLEADNQMPRLDMLQRIADALGVAVCSLLPGERK